MAAHPLSWLRALSFSADDGVLCLFQWIPGCLHVLGLLDSDEVCGPDVLSRRAEQWAMLVRVYRSAVGLWKVLIPPGMWWSVVVLLEGELDRLEGDPL